MSDKLIGALQALEKARVATLEAAIADRVYRAAATLDEGGTIQRGIDRVKRLIRMEAPDKPRRIASKSA